MFKKFYIVLLSENWVLYGVYPVLALAERATEFNNSVMNYLPYYHTTLLLVVQNSVYLLDSGY